MQPVPDDKRALFLTPLAAKRLFAAAEDVERDDGELTQNDWPRGAYPIHQFVVESGSVDAATGWSAGTVQIYDPVNRVFTTYGDVWIAKHDKEYARCVGVHTDNKPIFMMIADDPCCPQFGGTFGDDCRCDTGCGCDGTKPGGSGGNCLTCNTGHGDWIDAAGVRWAWDASIQWPVWCGPGPMPQNGPAPGWVMTPFNSSYYVEKWVRYDNPLTGCTSWIPCQFYPGCSTMGVGSGSSGGLGVTTFPGVGGSGNGGGITGVLPGGGGGGGSLTLPPISGGGIGGGIITRPPGFVGPDSPPILPPIMPDGGGTSLPYPPSPSLGGNLLFRGNAFGGLFGGTTIDGGIMVMPNEGGLGVDTSKLAAGTILVANGSGGFSSSGNTGQTVNPTISASQNDYSFGGMVAVNGDNVVVLASSGVGPWDITGISIGQVDRTRLYIIKTASAPNVILRHNSASSGAANKMRLGNAGADITLTGDKTVSFIYDGTQGNWKMTANSN